MAIPPTILNDKELACGGNVEVPRDILAGTSLKDERCRGRHLALEAGTQESRLGTFSKEKKSLSMVFNGACPSANLSKPFTFGLSLWSVQNCDVLGGFNSVQIDCHPLAPDGSFT